MEKYTKIQKFMDGYMLRRHKRLLGHITKFSEKDKFVYKDYDYNLE